MEGNSSGILIWIPFLREKTDIKFRNKRAVIGNDKDFAVVHSSGVNIFCKVSTFRQGEKTSIFSWVDMKNLLIRCESAGVLVRNIGLRPVNRKLPAFSCSAKKNDYFKYRYGA